eukprot:574831_1
MAAPLSSKHSADGDIPLKRKLNTDDDKPTPKGQRLGAKTETASEEKESMSNPFSTNQTDAKGSKISDESESESDLCDSDNESYETMDEFLKRFAKSLNKCANDTKNNRFEKFKTICEKHWNQEIEDNCGHQHTFQDLLLPRYQCRQGCGEIYYSFCRGWVDEDMCTWHCTRCNECQDWRVRHCTTCDKCTYGKCDHNESYDGFGGLF